MKNSFKLFLAVAAAAACIGATPLALSYAPSITKVAQATGDKNAAVVYRQKLTGCQKEANDSYLHFLERMSFISECMGRS